MSYSHSDSAYAKLLAQELRGKAVDVFLDTDLGVGVSFQDTLANAIARADAFLVILSPNYLASNWCRAELEYATNGGCRVIPILISGESQSVSETQKVFTSHTAISELPDYLIGLTGVGAT